jgi:CheY-like chemotaxis protein
MGKNQSKTRRKRTILVVDDEPYLVEYVRQVAIRCDYEVLVAGDGDEGWAVFLKNRDRIDLVLTDIVMPSTLDGVGLATNIQQLNPEMSVLFMTGIVAEHDLKARPNMQKGLVLRKPFNPAQLVSILRERALAMEAYGQ